MKSFIAILLLSSFSLTAKAQLGLNNPNPDASAILDLSATDRGLLIPRMNTGLRQAMAIGTPIPAQGLLVFDTDLNRLYAWDGLAWEPINPLKVDSTGSNEILRVETEMTIGSGFSSMQAPDNGLLVQGATGLGTNQVGSHRLVVDGTSELLDDTEIDGDLQVNGTVDAEDYEPTGAGKSGPIPPGGIIMWNGWANQVPLGWAVCDGTNGTPDLRNRFVVGAGDEYSVDQTGGEKEVTLTQAETPLKDHTHYVDLSTSENGIHNHGVKYDDNNGGENYGAHESVDSQDCCDGTYNTNNAGEHTHSVQGDTENAGTSSAEAHENRPPFYAVFFIMKL